MAVLLTVRFLLRRQRL